jgi:hypothetical protein
MAKGVCHLGRWEGEALSAMNLERDAARFSHEESRTIDVVATCGKQRLPFNVEVLPFWLNGVGLSQKREIGVVNLPSFGERNALSGVANVCDAKQAADRDRHRSDTSTMLANTSRFAEGECTKARWPDSPRGHLFRAALLIARRCSHLSRRIRTLVA